MNLRAEAALTIAAIIRHQHSLQQHFDSRIERVETKDKALFYELVYGTLRQFEYLRAISETLVQKPLRKKDSDVFALILVGLYQIEYMRIPDHAALSETVSGTKKLKKHWAKNLVNALLRKFLRERDTIVTNLADSDVRHRLPGWMLQTFKQDWPDNWQEIATNCREPGPITLRANVARQSRAALSEALEQENIAHRLNQYSESGLSLSQSSDLKLLDLADGRFTVQDEAAQLAAPLLMLAPQQRVLDACAAPGGKTTHILETEPKLAQLMALDVDEQRLATIADNLKRLTLDADLKCADAAELDDWWDGQLFDRILLDAPCSASGIIRRHPDIKLLRREDDIAKLATVQQILLNRLWNCLKPGGILLYATCSVFKQENVDSIAEFVENTADASHLAFDADWGIAQRYGRQLLPVAGEHDGFYYARLTKREPQGTNDQQ
jgi:16S rRNA (cytosine967-C5)-methyltransferase